MCLILKEKLILALKGSQSHNHHLELSVSRESSSRRSGRVSLCMSVELKWHEFSESQQSLMLFRLTMLKWPQPRSKRLASGKNEYMINFSSRPSSWLLCLGTLDTLGVMLTLHLSTLIKLFRFFLQHIPFSLFSEIIILWITWAYTEKAPPY